jgi:maltose alpha-D-glucosyltransferase / alpha-amylase
MASRMSLSSPGQVVEFLAGSGAGSLRDFLVRQRWFAAKARGLRTVEIEDWAVLDADRPVLLLILRLDGERYYVPLSVCLADGAAAGDVVARGGDRAIVDAHEDLGFVGPLLGAMAAHRELAGRRGCFVCRSCGPAVAAEGREAAPRVAVRISGEQSNTSVVVDRTLILKSIRRPPLGMNPDVEVLNFLAGRTGFRHVPPLAGWIEYVDARGQGATVAVLQGFVENVGDGWRYALAGLEDLCNALERPQVRGAAEPPEGWIATLAGPLIRDVRKLGVVTGGLHAALASDPHSPAFSPEPVGYEDVGRWCARIARELKELAFDTVAAGSAPPPGLEAIRETLRSSGGRIDSTIADVGLLGSSRTHKIRCHGDYHLGQVLKTADGFVILDFEGEPARALEERGGKHPPLRDVAGMLRSLSYAVHAAAGRRPPERRAETLCHLTAWERHARQAFFEGYGTAVADSPVRLVPASDTELARVCAVFEIEKACYELRYELDNRPDWAPIPADGILHLLESARS